jgi:hypothetical protein
VECSAEEIDEKYYIKIKIDNNYYKFIAEKSENGGGGEIEGMIKVHFQTEPWLNWDPLYVYYRLKPSNEVIFGYGDYVPMEKSLGYKGWHVFNEIDPKDDEGVEVRFFNEGVTSFTPLYYIGKDAGVVNIRQGGSEKVDPGYPVTVFFNNKGDWSNTHIFVRKVGGGTGSTIISYTDKVQMYDVSQEYGNNWYVFHLSFEQESAVEIRFYELVGGAPGNLSGYYNVSKNREIVNMTKDDTIVKDGPPN